MESSHNNDAEVSPRSVNTPIETEDSSEFRIITSNCGDDLLELQHFLGSHRSFQIMLNGGSSFVISPVAADGSPVFTNSPNGFQCSSMRESGRKSVFISNEEYSMCVVELTPLAGQDKNAPKIHNIFVPERLERIGWIETDSGPGFGSNSRIYVEGSPFQFQINRNKNSQSPFIVTVSDEANNAVVGMGSATRWTQTNLTYCFVPLCKCSTTMKDFEFTIDDKFDLQTKAVLFASFAAVVHDQLETPGGIWRGSMLFVSFIAFVIFFMVKRVIRIS